MQPAVTPKLSEADLELERLIRVVGPEGIEMLTDILDAVEEIQQRSRFGDIVIVVIDGRPQTVKTTHSKKIRRVTKAAGKS